MGLLDKPLPVSEAAVDNAVDVILDHQSAIAIPIGLRPAIEEAIRTVLSDDHTALRLAVYRCRLASNAMPWKSWGEVPRTVKDAYMASARRDLAAILGGTPEAAPEREADPQTKMED